MKKIFALCLMIVFIAGLGSPLAAYAIDQDYKTNVAAITLEQALKAKNLDQNTATQPAAPELTPYAAKEGALVIPLADALKNVEYTHPQIQLTDKKLLLYKKQYYASLSEAVRAKTNSDTTDTEMRQKELLNWRQKLNDLENLQHDRKALLDDMRIDFEKNYINGVQLQSDRDVLKKEVEKGELNIQQAKLRLKLGLIKESDLEKLNSAKAQLTAQLNSTERQLEANSLTIKQALGLQSGKSILLVPTNKAYVQFNDSKIGEAITAAAAQSYDMEKLQKDLELTKIAYHIAITYFEGPTPNGDSLENSVTEKEHSLQTSLLQQEASLWNSYYSLKNLEDNIEIQRIAVKQAERNLTNVATRIKLNQATSMDELVASIDLAKAKNQLQSLINQYMLAQESLVKDLTVTPTAAGASK
jgi:SMC interacting uncharacterized protein involved in chromosome segregation